MLQVAILLGLVEGLTEFLPVSSTGHLILVGHWLGYSGPAAATFEIVIQLGAILAVIWEYRAPLFGNLATIATSGDSRRFYLNLVIAFIPAAVLGVIFHDALKEHLFQPRYVALALIAGAVLIYLVEMLRLRPRTHAVEQLSWTQSLGIGVAQCAALVPGFSRSAATILGGLVLGLDRPTAASFSFLLAIPTILGAVTLDLVRSYKQLLPDDIFWMTVGFAVSFLAAWAAVRWFLRFISRHSLRVFAAYRLALGFAVLYLLRS
jgi:undecaprenyl-diphosphatase